MKVNHLILATLTTVLFLAGCTREVLEPQDLTTTNTNTGGNATTTDFTYLPLNYQLTGVGEYGLDLNQDEVPDLRFEIINLLDLNPQGLPPGFDTLAARAYNDIGEIHDNSTYNYLSAFDSTMTISNDGMFTAESGVLGTFNDAGQFQGQGIKYLGFRFKGAGHTNSNPAYHYGWAKLECEAHSQYLNIVSIAYRNAVNTAIDAGEK